ncbi:peptide chain release factor 2 [Emcibacter nanhaiensis]|uniref:Peptide chain release factor 2 n=1 Tax=Emcibacter nanhaiensis TaxID=1505037 RepID=A0A501PTD5_9PROT|nr:peptide chain release factor 2 [Emcibacter nanhaiensis]TPD62971.1 peptide chain release factor 2 [Emcibacter nanhaiensis]
MKAETQHHVDKIKQSLALLRRHLDWDVANDRLAELNALSEDPELWNDPANAQKLMQERQKLDQAITLCKDVEQDLNDNVELIEMGETEGDDEVVAEAEQAIEALTEKAGEMEFQTLLSGEADSFDTYVEIHSGAGGTESQDWASMLLRMYTRWAEQHGHKVEMIEYHAGEEAGIKSATILVKGENAYGWLKTESGVHRLVRISPYDSNARRHTSFASVWVYPVVDDNFEVEINESDLRVDTYRASGAGGQHVNTTDSAIRITHIPTNIVVQCQNDRSQHKNRATAMNMLKARLYEAELQRREEEANAEHASKTEIGWGHQLRSYVLQPYQMVKDLRTGVESGQPDKVLDGDLDQFLTAALAARVHGTTAEVEDID